MRLKSFFAESVETALADARRELGPDAMFVNSQRTTGDNRQLGEYEVVCALVPETEPETRKMTNPGGGHANQGPHLDRLSGEVADLRLQIGRLLSTMVRSSLAVPGITANPALTAILAELIEADIAPEIAHELVLRAEAAAPANSGPANWVEVFSVEAARLIKADTTLGKRDAGNQLIALVGPPGAGKTTSLVKLAVRYCVAVRRPCHLVTLDTVRIAAVEQLRSLAAIIGVPLHVVERPEDLLATVAGFRPGETVFFDTPGFAQSEMDEASVLAQMLGNCPELDIHLVLPASMRIADMRRIAGQFEIFSPSKVLFTKVDETESLGAILNLTYWTGKSVSFLGTGQQIPEDLEALDQDQLAHRVLSSALRGTGRDRAAAA